MRIDEIKTYEDLEYYFNKRRKIRFKDTVEIKTKNDVLNNTYNNDCSLATYYVKGKKHCLPKRARSIVDILMLLKYYFPESTLKENFDFIEEYNKNKIGGIYTYFCPNIGKHNFHGGAYYHDKNRYNNFNEIRLFNNLTVDKKMNVIK